MQTKPESIRRMIRQRPEGLVLFPVHSPYKPVRVKQELYTY